MSGSQARARTSSSIATAGPPPARIACIWNAHLAGSSSIWTPPQEAQPVPVDTLPPEYQTVDVDLTALNATMIYSEVNNMMVSPDSYMGKKVRMSGTFNYAAGENRYYYACLV